MEYVCYVVIAFCFLVLIKNQNTYRQRGKIIAAVGTYLHDLNDKHDERMNDAFL